MQEQLLPLANLEWKKFERLTLYLAENIIPGASFTTYLQQGNEQAGIDLLSPGNKPGAFCCIQCKRVGKMSDRDIDDVVGLFLKKEFATQTERFVISTTADLNNKKCRQRILYHARVLGQRPNPIIFECWDSGFLLEKLVREYTIVERFFSTAMEDSYCFRRKLPGFARIEKPAHYMARKVTPFTGAATPKYGFFYQRTALSLAGLFEESRHERKFFCLTGDAYQGKSLLLRQTAAELQELTPPYVSLFVEIKTTGMVLLEQILQAQYGAWKQVPASELVVFVDGLDEVATDRFVDAVNGINDFTVQYPAVHVVFSCRKLFYSYYKVYALAPNCRSFELYPFRREDIHDYLRKRLGRRYEKFNQQVNTAGLHELLYQPFYLHNFIDIYSNAPFKIPASKIAAMDIVIDDAERGSALRRLSRGKQLHEKKLLYRKACQKFAMALQLGGLNAMDGEQVQYFFTEDEIELLQQNALITVNGDSWSFGNAIFQEHLAARLLATLEYDTIIGHISTGAQVCKIKQNGFKPCPRCWRCWKPGRCTSNCSVL